MALKLRIHALGSYLKLTCVFERYILLNTKVGVAKDHGENYIKVRPLLVRYLWRNRLLFDFRNEITWMYENVWINKIVQGFYFMAIMFRFLPNNLQTVSFFMERPKSERMNCFWHFASRTGCV